MATHLIITGVVQGVGFRESMRIEAVALGLTGWVRNRRDGSVEAVVDGAPAAVRSLTEWARQGPRSARVSGIRAVGIEVAESCEGFEIRPSA